MTQGKLDTEKLLTDKGVTFTSVRPVYIYGPLNYNPVEEWFFHRIKAGRPIPVPNSGQQVKLTSALTHCSDNGGSCELCCGHRLRFDKTGFMPVLCIEWDLSHFHPTFQSGMQNTSANMLRCTPSAEQYLVRCWLCCVNGMCMCMSRMQVLTVVAASVARHTCDIALVAGIQCEILPSSHTVHSLA